MTIKRQLQEFASYTQNKNNQYNSFIRRFVGQFVTQLPDLTPFLQGKRTVNIFLPPFLLPHNPVFLQNVNFYETYSSDSHITIEVIQPHGELRVNTFLIDLHQVTIDELLLETLRA